MDTTVRRFAAIVGASAIATAITMTGTTAAANSGQRDGAPDRPCFMVRANWNNAEGPQPTCPDGRWKPTATVQAGVFSPSTAARTPDSMP